MAAAADPAAELARADAAAERALARQLATLAHSALAPVAPAAVRQAVVWWNFLVRLGVEVPLVVVYDFGWLLSGTRGRRPRAREDVTALGARDVEARWAALVQAIAEVPAVVRLSSGALRDELVAVVLARLLGDTARPSTADGARGARALVVGGTRWLEGVRALPIESPLYDRSLADLPTGAPGPGWALPYLAELAERREALLLRLEQLDLGPLRLLGLLPASTAPPDLAALHQLLGTPGAGEAARLSLELLPSLLETKRPAAVQRFAVGGYASVETRGSVDAILPSELAHDEEVFGLKALSQDLLYYGHERPSEAARREHLVLVDASASMRGMREVFARALAIALARKLALLSGDVSLRFFDSRLHRRVPLGAALGAELPYVLCFRSERGRNYGRVFDELLAETERQRTRGAKDLAITFLTHAECHVSTTLIERLARLARVYGVFILPSHPLELDYLPLLHGHQVVTPESLARPAERKRRGIEIVEAVARTVGPANKR